MKLSAALRVTGPGAAGSIVPSTLRIGCTSLVVPVRNASSAAASAPMGRSSSSAPTHSITRPLVTPARQPDDSRSEEHTSELQSRSDLVCRLLLEKKKKK